MKRIKSYVVLLLLTLLSSINVQANKTVHVIVVGDTNDAKIGTSVKTDLRLFDSFVKDLKSLSSSNGYTLKSYTLTGSKCSPSSVNNVINELSAQNDIIVFYYSGHGGRSHSDDASTKFPRMCLASHYADQWIKVSDALKRLCAKGPRFVLMITDCCNSYYDRKGHTESVSLFKTSNDSKVLQKLFFESKGYASITGASPGEYGWCTQDGAYLTLSFLKLLYKEVSSENTPVTWQSLLESVSNDTYQTTYEKYKKGWITNSQRPVFEVSTSNNNGGDSDPNTDDDTPPTDDEPDDSVYDDPDDGVYDNPDDGIYDNPDNNNDDYDYINDPDNHSKPRFGIGTLFTLLVSLLFGWLLIKKIPEFLNLEGFVLLVVRAIGIIIIIRAVITLL